MNERVKVDAGRVEAQEAWFVWVSEPGFTYAPDWAAGGSCSTRKAAMAIAVSIAVSRDATVYILVARRDGDPKAAVVSREHPEGVPVEWVGGES